jgi:hypothetical protein
MIVLWSPLEIWAEMLIYNLVSMIVISGSAYQNNVLYKRTEIDGDMLHSLHFRLRVSILNFDQGPLLILMIEHFSRVLCLSVQTTVLL